MYVAASVLVRDYSLYVDFSFLQMPYFPVFLGALFKLFGTTHYLLTARLLIFVLISIATILVFITSVRITGSRSLSISLAAIFSFNQMVILISQEASNYVPALACSVAAFYFFVRGSEDGRGRAMYLLCGLALALSVGFKLYYIVALPPFILASLLYPVALRLKERARGVLMPFVAGFVAGLLPVGFFIYTSGPDIFFFNNLGYHNLNSTILEGRGFITDFLSPLKALLILFEVLYPTNLVLAVGVLSLGVLVLRRVKFKLEEVPVGLFLSFFLLIVTLAAMWMIVPVSGKVTTAALPASRISGYFSDLAMSFIPYGIQYFATPVPFAVFLFAYLYSALDGLVTQKRVVLITMLAVSVIYGGGHIALKVMRIHHTNQWMGIAIHNMGLAVAREASLNGDGERIASLISIIPLEGGMSIYHEFATGPFTYRVGGLLDETERARYGVVSASDLDDFFKSDPPAVILTGSERAYEARLEEYAGNNGYSVNSEMPALRGFKLYLRRDRVLK